MEVSNGLFEGPFTNGVKSLGGKLSLFPLTSINWLYLRGGGGLFVLTEVFSVSSVREEIFWKFFSFSRNLPSEN